ncbi:uncharacterized protein LOC129595703 [Paramacrobiotus metropolitanus]|uniref:uncharacterized protein LOC129595703 n=1 Tax=Paramacrobiotus metropolitanus TaxID=2943436 RepID=UPI002445F0C4|nr:uncharacterized protein LOC129595703 [Paramacrobiotus metropolitanus]
MIFRPGTLVQDDSSDPFYFVCLNSASHNGTERELIVHRNQCVKELPLPDDGKSFFERTTGFLFRKRVIPFPQAQLLPDVDFIPTLLVGTHRLVRGSDDAVCDANCIVRRDVWVDEIEYGCYSHHKYCSVDMGVRMFVRVGTDAVTFICAEMQGAEGGCSMFWEECSLKKACDDYLLDKLTAWPMVIDSAECDTLPNDLEEMSIIEVLHPILASVLSYLDVDSQLRMGRVCALWRSISCRHANHRNILFDLCTACKQRQYDLSQEYDDCAVRTEGYSDYLNYKLMTTLDRVVPGRTRMLALSEDGDHFHAGFDLAARMRTIRTVLTSNGVRL